jgi:CSLREA domain-containing protein
LKLISESQRRLKDETSVKVVVTFIIGISPVTVLCLHSNPNCVVNYTVTKEEDTNDGVCSSLDCSLREAVLNANACPGPHTITLPAGGYTLTIPGINEDAGETGDLDITKDLTIIGIGAPSISGNIDRSFHYPPQFPAPEIYQKSSV